MRHDFLDRYSRLSSPLHRLPAFIKLPLALAIVILVVVAPAHGWIYGSVTLLLLSGAALSKIPASFFLRRLLFFEPFVVGIAALNLLRPGGFLLFLILVLKSTLSLFAMILLANTTPFTALLKVLRNWGAPLLIVNVLALMYRYLFVLIDEAERMTRARHCRTFLSSRGRIWRAGASVIAQMFLRSTERAERVYAAMIARGWK
jgi:cobalt/nickel transport system permease protein